MRIFTAAIPTEDTLSKQNHYFTCRNAMNVRRLRLQRRGVREKKRFHHSAHIEYYKRMNQTNLLHHHSFYYYHRQGKKNPWHCYLSVLLIVILSLSASTTSNTLAMSLSSSTSKRLVGKLHPERTYLLLCDMQERFRPLIWRMESVINTCQYMTNLCQTLDIPILATQQYTKVFGSTIKECLPTNGSAEDIPIYEKKKFSMLTDDVQRKLDESEQRDTFLLVGIEGHVCVQQTCLDLLEAGKHVHLVVDGISSQQAYDRQIALDRMQSAGAYLTTAQSAAFMLMQSADHPQFKAVSGLTKEHMKLKNEFNEAASKAT